MSRQVALQSLEQFPWKHLQEGNYYGQSCSDKGVVVEQVTHVSYTVLEVGRSRVASKKFENVLAKASVTDPDDQQHDS